MSHSGFGEPGGDRLLIAADHAHIGCWIGSSLQGVGGRQRTAVEPFDLVRAVNGHLVSSCRELQHEVERYPAGTKLRYLLVRGGSLVEEEIVSREMTLRTFKHFVVDNLLSGILVLGLGALVALLRPGAPTTRLFLAFCLTAVVVNVGSWDLSGTHRFTELFLFAWTFWPALFAHLALVFPERTSVARRWPRVVWVPYAMSAALWLWLQAPMSRDSWTATAGLIAIYWTVALVELLVGLGSTARTGSTPLIRQRARVLLAGFGIGYLVPVIGTTLEVVLHEQIPFLADVWRLAFVFPLAVAYAIVRYQLFDIRAVVRAGTVYSVVTAMVALGYAGLLTSLNVLFARLDLAMSGVVAPLLVAFIVVLLVNRVYARTQALLDRLFFRARYDSGQALARLADAMTTTLELDRLAALIGGTVDGILHPERVTLLLADDERGAFRRVGGGDGLAAQAVLATCLAGRREPLSRARRVSPTSTRWTPTSRCRSSSASGSPRCWCSDRAGATCPTPPRTCASSRSWPPRARWRSSTRAPTTRCRRPCAACRSSSRSARACRSSCRAPCSG